MIVALGHVAPVFLVIALGYLLRMLGLLREAAEVALSRLVFYVAAPLLLMRGIAVTPFSSSAHLPTIGVVIAASMFTAGLSYAVLRRSSPARRGVLAQGTHRSNTFFFGLPIAVSALGEEVVGRSAVLIGCLVVIYNLLGVLLLSLPHRDLSARSLAVWGVAARRIALNPLILGVAAGVVLSLSGIVLPQFLDRPVEMVGRTALPLALITLGAGLDLGRLRAELAPAAAVSAVKLIVYPAIVWLWLRELGLSGAALQAPVLLIASPVAVVSFIMAREMKGDERLAGAIVIGSTLLSVLTTVGWLMLFR
ncbi:AEC family transporter [bacterium]|nr:AEC family transporter [bacterium]MBU1072450.1 AEC family transporter [bacterium]MBU1676513.1 AEC family transporter [bacterium]